MQPDTIIPDLSNPQSWNRYSYVTNRPINFSDPTGHMIDGGCNTQGCDGSKYSDIQVLLRLASSSKNPRLKQHYQQKALSKTINEFGIEIIPDANHPLSITVGGEDPIDPENTYANTNYDPNLSPDVEIHLFDKAFEGTAGDLAATISHELCHYNQATGASCLADPQTKGERYYTSGIGGALNEDEARIQILANREDYGYGNTYGISQKKVDEYILWIATDWQNHSKNPDFREAWLSQIFILY